MCVLDVCERVLKVFLDLLGFLAIESLHLITDLVHQLLEQGRANLGTHMGQTI